jgi:small-conductance mechanosensitive channel
VTYHAVQLSDKKTAKIIAYGSKIIILFFTLMAVLWKVGIANQIIDTILIGFISMLAIAWGLAFGLGWKDIARDILESFRK